MSNFYYIELDDNSGFVIGASNEKEMFEALKEKHGYDEIDAINWFPLD